MKGKCLCGKVQFELLGDIPNLYQCHCSLCRKVSGSSSNSAMRIASERFKWSKGKQEVSSYQTPSGFISNFCSTCGSPVPNIRASGDDYWVPVGLLEEQAGDKIAVAAHLFVDSKAAWDFISHASVQFEEMPESEILNKILQK